MSSSDRSNSGTEAASGQVPTRRGGSRAVGNHSAVQSSNVVNLRPLPKEAPPVKKPFRQVQFELRESAILDATTRLLAEKGYEQVAMDDIALDVGIAKGSLYKHFDSKEALAAAVMLRLIRRTRQMLSETPQGETAMETLKELLAWTFRERLGGQVPHLPSTSPVLQKCLMANKFYMNELMSLSDDIGVLIGKAKDAGDIPKRLSDELVLFTLYARSCDATLDFLKATGRISDEEIVSQMLDVCMQGLSTR